jgi:hypothetical protein
VYTVQKGNRIRLTTAHLGSQSIRGVPLVLIHFLCTMELIF